MKQTLYWYKACFVTLFIFFAFSSSAQQTYPGFQRLQKPVPEPTAPGDSYKPSLSGSPSQKAPQIAEWTRTAGPDESIVITGNNFSQFEGPEEGKDTRFVVYATGGIKKDAKIQRIDKDKVIITLDKDLPRWSMYVIWPQNDNGFGAPVAVNKTDAWWVGPDKAKRGSRVSVFGRNLSKNNDTITSHVYIKPHGAPGQWAKVVKVNPYKVDFEIPTTISNGEYEVWAHNGHGGEFGWSGPVKLVVQDDPKWTSTIFNVKSFGAKGDGRADDTEAIKRTLTAAKGSLGSTIYFPAGTYMVNTLLEANSHNRWNGDGKDKSIIKCNSNFSSPYGFLFGDVRNFELNNLTFDVNKNYRGRTAEPIFLRGSSNVRITNVRFLCQGYNVLDLHHASYVYLKNTEFVGKVTFLGQCSQLFIDSCAYKLTNDTDMGFYSWGGTSISVTNSTCQDLDNSNPNDGAGWGKGRFFTFMGVWGSNRYTYIGNNVTTDLTPRPYDTDQNSGEQFLWEGYVPRWQGSPSAASSTTLTVSGYTLPAPNMHHAVVVKGRGLGQSRRLTSTNGGSLTIDEPWNVIPDESSVITIGSIADRTAVYSNFLDAKDRATSNRDHIAAAGVQPYGGATNLIVDNNTFHQLRQGTSNWAQQSHDNPMSPNYFSIYANNKYVKCYVAMNNQMDLSTPNGGIGLLGTMYRRNTVQDPVKYAITNYQRTFDYSVADASIYEHNSFNNIPFGFITQTPNGIGNQLFYSNKFKGTGNVLGHAKDITSKFLDRKNVFEGFPVVYNGVLPGGVIEAPYHVIEIIGNPAGEIRKGNFTLWNSGTGELNWHVSTDKEWLKLESTSGTIKSQADSTIISVLANPKDLEAGIHKAYITVKAGSQTRVYTVIFNLGSALLPDPLAPTVILTTPSSGSNFLVSSDIDITADAHDEDGSIVKVEFFHGSSKIGESTSSPFTYSWKSVAKGSYSITAKATDNTGLTSTSDPVTVNVTDESVAPPPPVIPNQPDINITAPIAGAKLTAPATVAISVSASDPDGKVEKVEFYNGNSKIGESTTAPFNFTWSGVAEGTYVLTAKATDNTGLSTTSQQVSVTIAKPVIPPTVSLTSTTRGNFTAPANVSLAADAADADGSVVKVEFFSGSTKIGEATNAPYTIMWNEVEAGKYSITAKATDNSGLTAVSKLMEITVEEPLIDGMVIYPNPFQQTTTIKFSVPVSAHVLVEIYNMQGVVVAKPFEGLLDAGKNHQVLFDAGNLKSGVYICRLTLDDGVSYQKTSVQKKLVLAR